MHDHKETPRRAMNAMAMKTRIFNTAIMLFSKHGYDDVKIDDITKYARISKSTFYTYFPRKDSVLVALFERIDEHYAQVFKGVPNEASARDRLLIFMRALGEYCTYVCGMQAMKIVYMNQIGLHKRPSIINNRNRLLYKIIEDIIHRGRESGEFACDLPEDEMVEFVVRSVRSVLYDWCLYDGASDLTQMGMRHFEILSDLFRAKALVVQEGKAGA